MKTLNQIFLYLFLISIFLFKIPNFYIIPFFKNPFTTTQALARILLVLVFCYQIINHFLIKKQLIFNKNNTLLINLIFLFFSLQSTSILVTANPISFLIRYKDMIIGLISFILFFLYKKHIKQIILIFLLSLIFNQVYQLVIFFYQDLFIKYSSYFIYQKHVDLVIAKLLHSNKIYTDTYDEIFFSVIFASSFRKKISSSLKFYFLLIIISATSFLSNIRTRILMLLIGFIGSILFFKKIQFRTVFILTLTILVMSSLVSNTMRYFMGYSFVDRFTFNYKNIENIKTVNFRFKQIKNAVEMGSTTLLGVGLGNYYDNLTSKNNFLIIGKSRKILYEGSQEFVHNIFGDVLAESGYISLILFLTILTMFIKIDLKILKSGENYQKALVISFWSLFFYGLFNPITPGAYQFLFWGIRGLLT